jgi:tocopherol O-methyltransferase
MRMQCGEQWTGIAACPRALHCPRMIYARTEQSPAAVARHYDELDRFYREVWGEHVHHGLWQSGRASPTEATEALIDLLAQRLGLSAGGRLVDIGCGYGATARMLAERFEAEVLGLTLSAAQASHAACMPVSRGSVDIVQQDWLANDLPVGGFDVAYAIESTEHMADKARFFREAARVLKPGGRLGVCAWLARENAGPLEIRTLLEPICREGRLPSMCTEREYIELADAAGFRLLSAEDLSARVRRTWLICAQRLAGKLLTDRAYRAALVDRANSNRIFALTLLRILVAYWTGSMRYGLLVWERAREQVS